MYDYSTEQAQDDSEALAGTRGFINWSLFTLSYVNRILRKMVAGWQSCAMTQTKRSRKCMEGVAEADFRTDAELEECDGVLPRAEVVRAAQSSTVAVRKGVTYGGSERPGWFRVLAGD
jgi:hypothetical protein